MLCSVKFNIRLKDADIRVIGFSKSGDTVSVFNSDNAARRAGGVYTVNRVAGKREMLLISRDNDVEKYGILNTDI